MAIIFFGCCGFFAIFAASETDSVPIPYRPRRGVSEAVPGADVLPVFSPDGKKVMWTSTRTPDHSSQLFIADFIPPKD